MFDSIKSSVSAVLGPRIMGGVDYFRFPRWRSSWGGPFNGQSGRLALFEAIARSQAPELILETGTFRGTTTEILADQASEVITIEGAPRTYAFAKARLRRHRNVRLLLGDSRACLREALSARQPAASGSTFAYLDAHWNDDLPLAEELEMVFGWDLDAIVMIDDFRVPDDPGYGYDDYGPGAALDAAYIVPAVARYGLVSLYPTLHSAQETGMRRGCVVLARRARWTNLLLDTRLLREA